MTIRLISGGATKAAFARMLPQFEKASGHNVSAEFAVTAVIDERIGAGEVFDVMVQPIAVLDRMQKSGVVVGEGRAVFGTVGLSVIVPKGAVKPDISTADRFKQVLIDARKIVHSTPGVTPSGTHLGKLMDTLGIASQMAQKTLYRPALEGGVETVGRGEAELGIYPTSEIIGIDGIDVAGPVPEALTLNVTVGAALTSRCTVPELSEALIEFLASEKCRGGWIAGGFAPSR